MSRGPVQIERRSLHWGRRKEDGPWQAGRLREWTRIEREGFKRGIVEVLALELAGGVLVVGYWIMHLLMAARP